MKTVLLAGQNAFIVKIKELTNPISLETTLVMFKLLVKFGNQKNLKISSIPMLEKLMFSSNT